ncbi:MAG TPA: fibronectin type III domain-containing protein, partial [Spirochaetota bacterium]|nr:fibronectin type III domain-containing protein [Spirochaetota bacterium]
VVMSKTHPDGKWVKSADAVISWTPPKDESGIVGYASLLSRDPDTNPTVQNLSERTRSETIRSLGEGITYYHLRAIDGAGNYSRTVHFPLRVSRSPLPMPVIESKTHPEGKGVSSDSPEFTWAISDIERVKGFVYKVSPNVPGKPDTFTENMNLSLSGLGEGRYFLRVQGIDKTNTPGRVADYEFIVGRAERIDPNEYRKYAMTDTDTDTDTSQEEKKLPVKVRVQFPSIELMPFAGTIESSTAEFGVKVKTSKGYEFDRLSYELFAGKALAYKGGCGGGKISLSGLSDGEYRIEVKGVFSRKKGKPYETKPVEVRFRILIPSGESPLVIVMRKLIDNAVANPAVPLIFFPFMSMMIFVVSSGRVLFYAREIAARVSARLRLIVSSFG